MGLQSNSIRQKLLEHKTLDLKTMFDQTRALESAMRSSESYTLPTQPIIAAAPPSSQACSPSPTELPDPVSTLAAVALKAPVVSFVETANILVQSVLLVKLFV